MIGSFVDHASFIARQLSGVGAKFPRILTSDTSGQGPKALKCRDALGYQHVLVSNVPVSAGSYPRAVEVPEDFPGTLRMLREELHFLGFPVLDKEHEQEICYMGDANECVLHLKDPSAE